MIKKVKIKIDGQEIVCDHDITIMMAAQENGIKLPSLCYHPDLSIKANCRVCAVEIEGRRNLATSCNTQVEEGMIIKTDSPRVKRSRNLNIELIFAEHIEKCPACIWRFDCALLELADKYKVETSRFKDRKGKRETYKFANAVEIDGSQCIDCRNCLEACNNLQKIDYLELRGKGAAQEVVPVTEKSIFKFKDKNAKKADCIYCGQCAVHCPVSAAQEQADWHLVEKALLAKSNQPLFAKGGDKVLVAQFAPSIRVSIGEEFGLDSGKVMTGQVVAALKGLGFNYVFDVNFSADITTIVEAEELLARIKSGQGLPMFTSCCPAWIKYVEFYRPDLIPNLTSARSPQMHSAGIIKTYWAEKMRINPKNIVVVSIMPCTAKKFEASRKELRISGLWPIDHVITTREFAYLMKKNKIAFAALKPRPADNPFGESSGAAAIYGASGGVMESALRTAEYLIQTAQNKVCLDIKKAERAEAELCGINAGGRIEFKDARGLEGVKMAELVMGGKRVRIAVVNGIGNIQPVLKNLRELDYIEVMACPDGCIGGGGQPIPTTAEIRKKRLAALYRLDGASKTRRAHENLGALEVLSWLKKKSKLEHEVLHTKYQKRK